MIVKNVDAVTAETPSMPGVKDTTMKLLIGEGDGAPHFFMRQFRVAPGGHTPLHRHDYEHEVYVVAGTGEVQGGDRSEPIRAGRVVFVPANETHQFRNPGAEDLVFLCLIPRQD